MVAGAKIIHAPHSTWSSWRLEWWLWWCYDDDDGDDHDDGDDDDDVHNDDDENGNGDGDDDLGKYCLVGQTPREAKFSYWLWGNLLHDSDENYFFLNW